MLAGLLAAGCATTGPGGKKCVILIVEQEEKDIGAKMSAQIRTEKKVFADRTVTDYVSRTGQKIARLSDRPDMAYTFTVIEDKTPNAFAVPGGYIYVHTGLLKMIETPSQLAGVPGHEISHIAARHRLKQRQEGKGFQILSPLGFRGSSR